MIELFLVNKGKFEKKKADELVNLKNKHIWLDVHSPSENELKYIMQETKVPEDMLKASLDEEERARYEEDEDSGYSLMLFDIPYSDDDRNEVEPLYTTMPISILRKDNIVITVCLKDTPLLNKMLSEKRKQNEIMPSDTFENRFLYNAHFKYSQYLRWIDKASLKIQRALQSSANNDELLKLSKLKSSLVYFESSLRSNLVLITELYKRAEKKTEEEQETIELIQIEAKQALETCNIYSKLLIGTTEIYSAIINNNINNSMNLLTAITVILAVPTLIASFWGMNTEVPFEGKIWGFWIIFAVSMVLTIITTVVVLKSWKKKASKKKEKKR